MRKWALHEKGGIINEQDGSLCTIRIRIPAGIITPAQMAGICQIAEKYGTGLHLTTRQTAELVHVNPSSMELIVKELEENGTPLGAEKSEIVNVTACPGTDRCKYAQVDSIQLALDLDKKHFGRDMPIKARIAISACPNSCVSERLNEIGITGVVRPYRIPGTCTGCGTCVHYCKEHAIVIKNGTINLDDNTCVHCGMCINCCPFHIIKSDPPAYHITVGGKRGRHPKLGHHFVTVRSQDTVHLCVDKVIEWIYRRAWGDILLPDQLDDIGFEKFRAEVVKTLPQEEIVDGY
ncbi:MAG TPA: 4Fe-4S dicluster domain-containing protein [Methanospirillum sp.]|nr:4Fe-4S dicluster domain-containing protein [Methanospirillum sp.]